MVDDRTGVKRRYRQGRRARTTAATRQAIRDAAIDAFLSRGYTASTMRHIATAAGVGERTLYDAFPTKEQLFRHVADVAIGGDEQSLTVAQRPEFHDALRQQDPAAAVRMFAHYSAATLERAGPIIMVAVGSSGADPTMRAFADQGAQATRRVAATFIAHLATIHPVTDPDTATATVLAVASPHVHQILRTHAGLDSDAYRDWLAATLTATLTH